jgi:Mannosyl-glycoprotein endo-beta-N-acetylglucosaminidase.
MPHTRQISFIIWLVLLLTAAPAPATAEGLDRPIVGQSFYERITNILKHPPTLEPAALEPAGERQVPAPAGQTPILGAAEIDKAQMVKFIRRNNPVPKLSCALEELVELYWEEAGNEGIRPDFALAQAILETGFFRFGGDVLPTQNNFAGLGTTGGGLRGAWFDSPRLGVRAHIQHLLAYTTTREPLNPIIDPRYSLVRALPQYSARCNTWESLGGKWAIPGIGYGERIVKIISYIKGGG